MEPTCCGWCSAHTAALREKSSRAARILPLRCQSSDHRRMVADAWLFVPEGRRRKLAGGARASGRGPRGPRRTGHAPAGHRRSFSRRPSHSVSATARHLGQVGSPAIGRCPGPFLRCPAGARSHSPRFPGAASAGADLPPANLLRRPSGTGTGPPRTDKGKPPAREWRSKLLRLRLRRAVLQLCKILARREDFSRSAAVCAEHQPQPAGPREATDFNGCLRGFWAAAAGPRRTQPRSLGGGSVALCSSCLCDLLGVFHCIVTDKVMVRFAGCLRWPLNGVAKTTGSPTAPGLSTP